MISQSSSKVLPCSINECNDDVSTVTDSLSQTSRRVEGGLTPEDSAILHRSPAFITAPMAVQRD
jgi:hypothetical protein